MEKLVILTLVLVSCCALAQNADSTINYDGNSAQSSSWSTKSFGSDFSKLQRQKNYIVKGSITVGTYNLQLSAIETEISNVESMECIALLKRDTAALKSIWIRDFTLEAAQNEIYTSLNPNPLPYYTSISRIIEDFFIMEENVVYTKGKESSQQIKGNGKLDDSITRNFSHMWTRKAGVWRLSSKRYE